MKPSHHRALTALLHIIPIWIYCSALGLSFIWGLVGLIALQFVLSRVVPKILPPVAEKKP